MNIFVRCSLLALVTLLIVPWILFDVGHATEGTTTEKIFSSNFANGSLGWSADFADYPPGEEEFYRLAYNFAKLPPYLATNQFALQLVGSNHSDDLCMFLRKKINGLRPNTNYRVTFRATIASNAPNGAFGIGGAPGESVFVKVGASLLRPAADSLSRQLNIDKGNQAADGTDAITIGHIGVNTPFTAPLFRFKTLTNGKKPFTLRTDDTGTAWLFFATDSGFEGTSKVYIVSYRATFNELP